MSGELRVLAPRLTRRRVLGLLALSVGGALAGCAPGGREGSLALFSWAEYSDPATLAGFTEATGTAVTLDVYDSNEAALARLELDAGGAGYDLVVPTGPFVPLMVERGLLRPLDHGALPNLAEVDPAFLDPPWDPGNRHTVVKDWGSTGIVLDRRVVDDVEDWAGFLRAAARPQISGRVAVLDDAHDLAGMVLWREGIDWTTTDPAALDLAERVLLEELAPHVRAFDSYPAVGMLDGSYVMAQAFSGDARTVVLEDPERYRFVLPRPRTELWVDNWAVLAGAPNPSAAHAFIDHVLRPEVSAQEIAYHGYDTAVPAAAALLPEDLGARELIFFTPEERARMVPGAVTAAQGRLVAILERVRAAAGLTE